ncbi:MAG: ZIP family metal transporter [Patescibacteria group bacterium]
MLQTYIYTFSSITIISLISFIGALTLAIPKEKLNKISLFFVSLSAGTLLGGAFLHLIPEVVEKNTKNLAVWLWLLNGIIVFFVLEKIIHWRHCHIPTSEAHPHPLGIMNLVGDGFHNIIDGIIIAGSFLINIPLGVVTSIAVIIHEIPQEMADFGVLIHAGFSRKKALLLNFLVGLTALFGGFIALLIGTRIDNFSTIIIPFTAGGFIYIATADLIPELKKDTRPLYSFGQLIIILLGIAIMYSLLYLGE